MAQLQLQVFSNREVHIMALLYLMGMGSLLGFAISYPLLIKAIFGLVLTPDNSIQVNPVSPAVLIYDWLDRKSTRLNSSHVRISYAVFCLKKKKLTTNLLLTI